MTGGRLYDMPEGFHPPLEEYLEAIHELGEEGRRKSVSALKEPAGEPRVRRNSGASRPPAPRRGGLAVDELEVPEFLPNF